MSQDQGDESRVTASRGGARPAPYRAAGVDWPREDLDALAELARLLEPRSETIARAWAERLVRAHMRDAGPFEVVAGAIFAVQNWLLREMLQRLRERDLARLFKASRRYHEALLRSQLESGSRFQTSLEQLNASLDIVSDLVAEEFETTHAGSAGTLRMLRAWNRVMLRTAQIAGTTFHQERSEALERALQTTSALLESARELSTGPRSVAAVVDSVADIVRRTIPGDQSVLFLWSPVDRAYALAAHRGLPPAMLAVIQRLRLSHRDLPLVARALERGSASGTREEGFVPSPLLAHVGIGAYALSPMIASDGRPLGAVAVLRAEAREFDAGEIAILRGLGRNAALAIENAMLAEQLAVAERRKQEDAGAARDSERRRVARELHDCVLQDLGGLKLHLESVVRRHPLPEVERVIEAIIELIAGVRRVVDDLRHPDLDNLSFRQAVAAHAHGLARRSGIAVDIDLPAGVELADWATRDTYRIAQEAIANAVRHAAPHRLRVSLSRENGANVLVIGDDGAGFDAAAATLGSGIVGMRERAAAIGAELRIDSAPGAGTTVSVVLPRAESPPWGRAESDS